jgi:hypothetical protein
MEIGTTRSKAPFSLPEVSEVLPAGSLRPDPLGMTEKIGE